MRVSRGEYASTKSRFICAMNSGVISGFFIRFRCCLEGWIAANADRTSELPPPTRGDAFRRGLDEHLDDLCVVRRVPWAAKHGWVQPRRDFQEIHSDMHLVGQG